MARTCHSAFLNGTGTGSLVATMPLHTEFPFKSLIVSFPLQTILQTLSLSLARPGDNIPPVDFDTKEFHVPDKTIIVAAKVTHQEIDDIPSNFKFNFKQSVVKSFLGSAGRQGPAARRRVGSAGGR